MSAWLQTPGCAVALTVGAYALAHALNRRYRRVWTNPLLLSAAALVLLLGATHADIGRYEAQTELISFWLGPATVALAIPLYKQYAKLRAHLVPIAAGVGMGVLAGLAVAPLVAWSLGSPTSIIASLVPRSVTTPIAIQLAPLVGGIPSLTAVFVTITGLLGNLAGPEWLRWLGVTSPVALGVAVGAGSHGIGTARLLAEHPESAGFSALGMTLAGLTTALVLGIWAWG